VQFTVRRLTVAGIVAAMMLGMGLALERATSPDAQIQQWIKDHPDQPKPELIASGVSKPLTSLLWLAIALGAATLAAVLLWPVRHVTPDPPEPN